MIVGVPREVKDDEYRVGVLPVGVEELTRAGHRVLVQAMAGIDSGVPDHDYLRHGAEMVDDPDLPGLKVENRRQIIPARYNNQSDLTLSVTAETAKSASFTLTSD